MCRLDRNKLIFEKEIKGRMSDGKKVSETVDGKSVAGAVMKIL